MPCTCVCERLFEIWRAIKVPLERNIANFAIFSKRSGCCAICVIDDKKVSEQHILMDTLIIYQIHKNIHNVHMLFIGSLGLSLQLGAAVHSLSKMGKCEQPYLINEDVDQKGAYIRVKQYVCCFTSEYIYMGKPTSIFHKTTKFACTLTPPKFHLQSN